METPTRAETPDESAAPAPQGSARRPARRSRSRSLAFVALGALTVFAVMALLTLLAGLNSKRGLDRGRVDLQEGKKALVDGDLGRATDAFGRAERSFAEAQAQASSGLGAVVRAVPVLGRNLDVVAGAALAGRELATAGAQLTSAVAALPDGLGSLAPQQGRLPVDDIASLSDDVRSADAHAAAAVAAIDDTPSSLLAGPVAGARAEVQDQVTKAATTLRSASLLLGAFPAFAGADGPRHYLLVAESPAEQRGTGGIWGAYAILTADRGELSVSSFRGVLTLPELAPDDVPAPNPDYRRNYDAYGGAGSFRDLNMTPDFPSAARAALGNYEVGTGERLDGVISADPFALRELFKVTGPATIPSLGATVNADNVVTFTTNEAYVRFARAGKARKEALGSVAGAAFDEFLTQPGDALPKLKAVGRAVADGHLKVYSTDPAFQEGLRVAGRDGALSVPTGADLLSVVVNNVSGSKIDYYVARSVSYRVTLGGEGQAFATTTIALRNDAPDRGVPGYVIRPATPGYRPGDAVNLITASCPTACELVRAERDGKDVELRVGSELGHPWYQDVVTVPSRSTSTLEMVTARHEVWQGNSTGGIYRVRIMPQTTVQPTHVTVTIEAPGGTHIAWTSEPMNVSGGTAVWEGDPAAALTLQVRFGAPIPLGWWRNLTRPLI